MTQQPTEKTTEELLRAFLAAEIVYRWALGKHERDNTDKTKNHLNQAYEEMDQAKMAYIIRLDQEKEGQS